MNEENQMADELERRLSNVVPQTKNVPAEAPKLPTVPRKKAKQSQAVPPPPDKSPKPAAIPPRLFIRLRDGLDDAPAGSVIALEQARALELVKSGLADFNIGEFAP